MTALPEGAEQARLDAMDITLDGREVDLHIGAATTAITYDLAIDSTVPLTIVLQDQQRQLLKSGLLDRNEDGRLDRAIEVKVDAARYRLAAISKAGDTFTLPFEDRVVSLLRSAKGKLKPRPGEGHVRFAKRLVELVGADFVTPTGLAVVKSGTALGERKQRDKADERREKGIATGASLKVKGAKATREQIRNMEVVLGVAAKEQAGDKATLALVIACIIESLFRNEPGGDRDSKGILQLRVGLHGEAAARSVSRSATLFLDKGFTGRGGAIALAKANPDWTAGQVAQAVQGSAHPDRYDQVRGEGRAIIAAYGGTGPVGDTSAGKSRAAVLVQRGTPENPNENSWTCLQRMAAARGYRCHALRNRIYYAREQDLIRARARATLSEDLPGIDWIDWEWSPRKKVNTATVQCVASLWALPPGVAVILEDAGPADGRWLVSAFRRSRDSKVATVELRRGTELLQPEPTRENAKAAGGSSGKTVGGASITVGGLAFPLAVRGKNLGGPAAHKARAFGNWQSDNAVDIGVAQGTRVFAVEAGEIVKLGGSWRGGSGNPDGFNVTLRSARNQWFYTHLRSRAGLRVGQRVGKGDFLGISGAANGVPHLHIGSMRGDPERMLRM